MLDEDGDKEEQNCTQGLHSRAYGPQKCQQDDQGGLPQEQNDLPVVVFLFIPLRQEPQAQLKALVQVIVDLAVRVELVVRELPPESLNKEQCQKRHTEGPQNHTWQ